jgi:hypothetical protein
VSSLVTGCSPGQIRKDFYLDQIIKEAKVRCDQALRDNPDVFRRIEVTREGDDTVRLDYVLTPEAESRVNDIRTEYQNAIKSNENARKDFQRMIDAGISVRIVYKNSSGEILDDFRMSGDDL